MPGLYQSPYLNPLDTPRAYLDDACEYLKARWNPNKAVPGTVVMIIMFHGITKGPPESHDGIHVIDFNITMQKLKEQGFEAINTVQLVDFLYTNAKIPPRSVVIIQDDRHRGQNFEKNFREYWENWGWPVINGWPSQPDTLEIIWEENIALENEGWVDHQSQGVMIGTHMSDESSDVVLNRELKGSITAFEERYNKTPLAIIWPGGGFGARPVQAARELGYEIGFTINPRGPVMFNWVPQSDVLDEDRPSYMPEGSIHDPLMTLPRYWPYQVLKVLDEVRITGKEAAAYAEKNKAAELEYYDIVCTPTHGPMPGQP